MNGVRLGEALDSLETALPAIQFPLPLDGAEVLRALASSLGNQVRDYLQPRAARLDAPLLAVVGGSTGAGKSTIVNSLLRAEVSQAGVLRPTTKSPVLVCHPADQTWFQSDRVLPGLVRTDVQLHDSRALRLVTHTDIPPGLALLDAPDIDSIDGSNRALARQLLLAADLWLFITSAARYADAVPWDYLDEAALRNVKLGVVINRCPPGALAEVAGHLSEMLSQRGLAQARLFAIAERAMTPDGLLPPGDVGQIKQWLGQLAAQAEARAHVAIQTLAGAVRALDPQLNELLMGLNRQRDAVSELRVQAVDAYRDAASVVNAAAGDGSLMRGEILARWQDLVGTGELMRSIEERISVLRDRVSGWIRGEPKVQAMQQAISDGLATVVREEGERAAEAVAIAWQRVAWGREIIAAEPALARPTPRFAEATAETIRAWQADVVRLVEEQGAGKRMKARFLALGTNAVGAAIMVVVFSMTGGLTAAEVGIASGASILAQRLLEAAFGEDAVRRLARQAQRDLADRIDGLFADELGRHMAILDSLSVERDAVARLETAAELLRTAASDAFDDLTRPEI